MQGLEILNIGEGQKILMIKYYHAFHTAPQVETKNQENRWPHTSLKGPVFPIAEMLSGDMMKHHFNYEIKSDHLYLSINLKFEKNDWTHDRITVFFLKVGV